MASALPFVKRVWSSFLATSGLEPILIPRLKLLEAVPGYVKMELTIEKSHTVSSTSRSSIISCVLTAKRMQNRLQILHGGTVASLVDLAGSLAVSSRGMYSTGESRCHKLGRSLAFTSVEFFKSHKYELFARGTHITFIATAMKDACNLNIID
ncbi:hypothetical protein V1527DRAFT_499102 [Lipomyces starkeyi]